MGLAVWAAWFGLYVVPEWIPPRVGHGQADRQMRDRVSFEAIYTAGWLTRYVRQHGAFPNPMPHNPLVGRVGGVTEACIDEPHELSRCDADWAWCPSRLTVQALACPPNNPPADGGADFTLWPLDPRHRSTSVDGSSVVVPEPPPFEGSPGGAHAPPGAGGRRGPPPPAQGPGLPNGRSPSS